MSIPRSATATPTPTPSSSRASSPEPFTISTSANPSPPAYDIIETHPLPIYSPSPAADECLLQIEPPRMTNCPNCDWVFVTPHLRINLGPRMWNVHAPCYGLGGRVDGCLWFRDKGEKGNVARVYVKLEGRIKTILSHRNTMTNDDKNSILVSQTTTIFDVSEEKELEVEGGWTRRRPFTVDIPREAEYQGQSISLPPSHFSYFQDLISEVYYTLKFVMVRKGLGIKRHESRTIRILYLPKSTPAQPPLRIIPRPSRTNIDDEEILHMFNRVKTVALTPYHLIPHNDSEKIFGFKRSRCRRTPSEQFCQSVFLSLPEPKSFGSGEKIPFTLSLVFPSEPSLAHLYTQGINVYLIRRMNVWKRPAKNARTTKKQKSRGMVVGLGKLSAHHDHDQEDHVHRDGEGEAEDHSNEHRSLNKNRSTSEELVWKDVVLATASLRYAREYEEGVALLRGEVQAGAQGKEVSWSVDGVMEVQYVLRVTIRPPPSLIGHVPGFKHEEIVDVTTDGWGVLNRELSSMGGTPTPAIGLAAALKKIA